MSFEPQSPDWYRALTLSERIEALQGHAPADSATSEACIHERLERWHAEFGHALDDYLSVCAALHGLSRNDLASCAPIEAVRGRVAVPPWLRSLELAFRAADSGSPIPFEEILGGAGTTGFLNLIEPLLRQARQRLRDGVEFTEARGA